MSCLVFDIGGTNVRAARFNKNTNSIYDKITVPALNNWTYSTDTLVELQDKFIGQLSKIVAEFTAYQSFSEMVIGFPGPVDNHGNVIAAPTLWGEMKELFPLEKILKRLWPLSKIKVINDVTASGYRYVDMGDESFCILTVSSGIGNKLFIQGRPLCGENGYGGEIGHYKTIHTKDTIICDCGEEGHLGAIASGRGILNYIKKMAVIEKEQFDFSRLCDISQNNISSLNNELIVACFKSQDLWTVKKVTEASMGLGQAIAMLHLSTGVDRFIIIGGFAVAMGVNYIKILIDHAKFFSWNIHSDWNKMISLGYLDDDHGLIGAGKASKLVFN